MTIAADLRARAEQVRPGIVAGIVESIITEARTLSDAGKTRLSTVIDDAYTPSVVSALEDAGFDVSHGVNVEPGGHVKLNIHWHWAK